MNKKGFTLIEVIGVIVIIGLILMIVFPTLSKLMLNNNIKKYDNYYMLIDEAAKVYAGTLKDKMGPSTQNGCAEFTLNDLVSRDYIKAYNDKRTTCTVSSSTIRVKNTRGKIETFFKMTCKDEVPSTADYVKGEEDVANCIAYTKTEGSSLYQQVKTTSAQIVRDGNIVYVTNDPVKALNKYIYYSGSLWQIVNYDEMQETVKALNLSYVTALPFDAKGSNVYTGSTMQKWLENVFYPNLKNPDQYLTMNTYDASPSTNFNLPISSNPAKVYKSKIGLLSAYEARKIKHPTASGILNRWTLSEGATGFNVAFTQDNMNLFEKLSNSYAMPIPVITFGSSVEVVKGVGTATNPYIIEPDYKGESGQQLATRPAGEYFYLNFGGSNQKFRIIGKDDSGNTRATIHVNSATRYDQTHYDFSTSDIKERLNTTEYNKFSTAAKALLVDGYFCNDSINPATMATKENLYTSSCSDPSKIKMYKIGLYKLGELYPPHPISARVWTMNPSATIDDQYGSSINVINGSYDVEAVDVAAADITYNIVVTVTRTVLIESGEGTSALPYVIK